MSLQPFDFIGARKVIITTFATVAIIITAALLLIGKYLC